MTEFTCRECKNFLPLKDIKKGTLSKKGTGKCKKCQAEYSRRKNMELHVSAFPEKYRECNNCDRYYSILKTSGRMENPLNCKYCNSPNTQWVLE